MPERLRREEPDDLIQVPLFDAALVRQEIARRKLQRFPRAKTKDSDIGQRPVLRPVIPAFWKSAESW